MSCCLKNVILSKVVTSSFVWPFSHLRNVLSADRNGFVFYICVLFLNTYTFPKEREKPVEETTLPEKTQFL